MSYDTSYFVFIPGLLEEKDKHIEVADGHYITVKQKVQVQTKVWDNNGNTFIATLQNVLLAPIICDRLFTLINSVHTYLFHKGFFTVYFEDKKENAVTLPHSAQSKYTSLVKTKEKAKSKKVSPRNKLALELLHHILGHRYTRSLMAGGTENVWQDI